MTAHHYKEKGRNDGKGAQNGPDPPINFAPRNRLPSIQVRLFKIDHERANVMITPRKTKNTHTQIHSFAISFCFLQSASEYTGTPFLNRQ